MPIINVLPLDLRNKIAAGEVVERPASVVKEFIENSIDAESTRIDIEIQKAGRKLIKVSDNGLGMDREDALLSFERYATSKLRDEKDLFSLRTMGFRGEALSSIAAVSKIRLVTATKNAPAGTCVEITGGEVKDIRDCPAAGTTIEVKDLFFNTPARRKFLKSDSTENYHITDTVTREAMSHPRIGFFLRMDGEEVLCLPAASSHMERLVQIYGKEFGDALIEKNAGDEGLGIKAFMGKSTNLRNNRNNQFLFINKRPVKDQSVSYAACRGYEGLIPKDKHPVFFLFLETSPDRVDFNVHPTKREVRFADKNTVFNFVYHAVRAAVGGQGEEYTTQAVEVPGSFSTPYPLNPSTPSCLDPLSPFPAGVSEPQGLHFSGYVESVPFLYLGETFIAIAGKNGLMLIDYHAAHERVNYERLLKRAGSSSFRLLFPQQVKLRAGEYRIILGNLQLLNELGIEAEDFGHDTIIVRSVPEMLRDADLDAVMGDVAAALLAKGTGDSLSAEAAGLEPLDSVKKVVAARLACHKSIRGKEVPDGPRIAELLRDLDKAENPAACPHGRPTRIMISVDELKKMFRK